MSLEVTDAWLHAVARTYTNDPHSEDDAAQEGRIAAWRASLKGHRGGNQARAARWRIKGVLFGHEQPFGRESTRGRRYVEEEPHDTMPERTGMNADIETGVDVRAAVRQLPAGWRRIVWLRVWQGQTWDEISAEVGVSRPHLMKQWEHIACALRTELSDAA